MSISTSPAGTASSIFVGTTRTPAACSTRTCRTPNTSPAACDSGQHPNNSDADATLNVVSHEHNETITDPLGSSRYNASGYENGDLCAWKFGKQLGSTQYGSYNEVMNGHDYELQQEWSNDHNSGSGACVLSRY